MPVKSAVSNSSSLRIEYLLTDYLFQQGHLTLPGIGVIRHEGAGQVEQEEESGRYRFSPENLSFEYSPKVEMDGDLVAYISRETGKMKSLASSDLESFLQFGQELINISKPFHIRGLGVIQKTSAHTVEFQAEDSSKPVFERGRKNGDEARRHKIPEGQMDLSSGRGGLQIPLQVIWGLGLAILLAAGYAIFKYTGSSAGITNPVGVQKVKDGAEATPNDTKAATSAGVAKKTPSTFRVVIEYANRERALKRFADLKEWGHDIRMTTQDSLQFKLYIPIAAPLSDTAYHRDSLRIFFGRPVRIETIGNE